MRHPPAEVAPGTCYGRLDLAAPVDGAELAMLLAALPAGAPVRSSPALRCSGLAERLARGLGSRLAVDPRLQELDFGAWEGRRWTEIDRAESDPWAADPWRVAPPGGETFGQLLARVGAALAEAPAEAVIVTHAGPIRAARMLLLDESFEAAFALPVPHLRPIPLARERA